jgi:integrase
MADIYKRGKTYWARAQRDGQDIRRSLKTADKRTAETRFRQWLEELDGAAFDGVKRSYAEAEERFVKEHLTTLKPTSARRYGVSLTNLAATFGNKMLHEIGSAELSGFETRRRTDGVTSSTIRRDLACLSSLLTSAIDWEWLKENPVPGYLRRRAKRGLKEGQAKTRYLTEAEEKKLLDAASDEPRQAMMLALDTGLRLNELFDLKWSQVDLEKGVISTGTVTKSGRNRVVPVPARSAQILRSLKRYPKVPYVLVNPDTETRFVTMQTALRGARRRAGIAHVTWHDLRRTAGCRWLQRDGRTLAEVSMLLGHSSVLVTEKSYAFLNEEAVAMSISSRTKPGTD